MDRFIKASQIAGAGSKTKVDTSVNIIHVINMIAYVYGRTAKEFLNVKPKDVERKAIKLAGDESLLRVFAKGNKVSDCDVVSLIEALKWTGIVVTTGVKPTFNLALIEPTEMKGMQPELATKQPKVWNAFLLSDYEGTEYTEYGRLPQAKEHSVTILGKSLDSYSVTFQKGVTNENEQ